MYLPVLLLVKWLAANAKLSPERRKVLEILQQPYQLNAPFGLLRLPSVMSVFLDVGYIIFIYLYSYLPLIGDRSIFLCKSGRVITILCIHSRCIGHS